MSSLSSSAGGSFRHATGIAALAATLLLGACSSLPTIVPDMSRKPARVQIEGRQGPLSAEQSRAILEKLKAGAQDTSLLDRHLAFEQAVVGSPLLAGNKVTLLVDGPSTYKAMFAAIAQARDHINMETYILEDDEVGQQFADALIGKQRAGVQVNLIHDGVGTLGTPAAFFERLKEAGIRVLEYNPVNPLRAKAGWDVNGRDHRKLLVVDGRTAFLGGINISSVYSGGSFSRSSKPVARDGRLPWRDTDLQIDGPVVAEFQKLFIETWQRQKGDALPDRQYFPALSRQGSEVVRAVGSAPEDPYSLIYATLISALSHAENEILLTNAYFVPDPQLLEAITAAARRGVDVKLLLPSKTDSWLVLQAGRASYTELLKAGVKIYERHDALLHSKTALIDGIWVTVGSTNLDWRSFLHNQEVNAVVLGPEFGRQMRALFERDLAASEQVTLERWKKRGLGPRVKETLSKLWEYWL
jgi:cardiolipin synthase